MGDEQPDTCSALGWQMLWEASACSAAGQAASSGSSRFSSEAGERGVEGKILASKFAREQNMPYLGLCLGMHVASIDIARHLLNLPDAHSSEFNPTTPDPIIHLLESQEDVSNKGGTMRLGSFDCHVASLFWLLSVFALLCLLCLACSLKLCGVHAPVSAN